jgi:hypothetical protein
MNKAILSILLIIFLITTIGYYLKGQKINCKPKCDSKVQDINNYKNEVPLYYPFFIKV